MIKFRAWDEYTKEMYYDVTYDKEYEGGVRPWIFMQFIDCLPDKKGKEIYDKDIIKTGYLEDKGYLIGVVEYQKRSARWGIRVGHRLIEFGKRGRWYEVIGNTCENPKLLKEV